MMYIPLIPMVFQTYQRYNFESKSQPFESEAAEKGRCFRPIKDTILKANHNWHRITNAVKPLGRF